MRILIVPSQVKGEFEMLKISIYFFFIKISGSETGLFKIEK
jgi:hypothetical protein